MRFASTRDKNAVSNFSDAIFQGLAPDGGLYQPIEEADLRPIFQKAGPETSFQELAAQMTAAILPDEYTIETARRLCAAAFPFEPKLRTLSDRIELLELFHGPSCAFKDFGASFLAAAMQDLLRRESRRAVILVATSGDTGSAVAQAFHGKDAIDVVILYPSGRVSPSQEMQLTTVGDNVYALEVEGSFDDCQRMVKEAFLDNDLRSTFPLTSANSINLGRLFPQSFYYAWAFEQIKRREPGEVYFCVPSGNFGNLTAGVLAWRWGLPVKGFIAATNANDVVPEYLASGIFSPRSSVATPANAMDVGYPSNFERLHSIFDMDWDNMKAIVHGEVVTDAEILTTIRRYHTEYSTFICPHTAVGVLAAERYRDSELAGEGTIIALSTAHPGKFTEVVHEATGVDPDVPERLAEYMRRTKHADKVKPSLEALATWMKSHLTR